MNNTVKTTEELCIMLRNMKLSGMAEDLEKQEENPNRDLVSFDERVSKIIESEWTMRYNKKFDRFLKKANLRYPDASFDDTVYDLDRQLDTKTMESLLDCKWIESGRNLIITGKCGGGKSYFSNVLAVNALRQFKKVRYMKTENLILQMDKAHLENTVLETINDLSTPDLLILDDFGLMDLDLNKCRNLFEVIDAREGRRSMIVISQFPVNAWFSLFKDSTFADACLDRLVHGAFRLEFNGKNMRNPQL